MRFLAEFIMRGRTQATLVVVLAAVVPMMSWLSAAAASLVLLRRGQSDALPILMAGLAAAGVVWWVTGESNVALVLSGTFGLALLLRSTASWLRVLLASVGLGLLFALLIASLHGEQIALLVGELQKVLPQMLQAYQALDSAEQARFDSFLQPVLIGAMAAMLQLSCLLALMLGRWWQALLYNPGGFAEEGRALRLPWQAAVGLMLVIWLGGVISPDMAMLMPICTVPLAVAGLSLLHGLVAQKRLPAFWLIGIYVLLVLFQAVYLLLVLLAVIDSLFDFRGRHAPSAGKGGPTNGEG